MKVFLFFYPIKPIIDHEIKNWFWRDESIDPLGRLNELVDIRYRKQGYKVIWLVFSKHGNKKEVDQDLISPLIQIEPSDSIIRADISFQTHTCKVEGKYPYPSPAYISEQLPTETSEIKIGGFHQTSCVNLVGEHLYYKGFDVLVDEDLTDRYFFQMGREAVIPDHREFTADDFGVLDTLDNDEIRQEIADIRRARPWFAQPKRPD